MNSIRSYTGFSLVLLLTVLGSGALLASATVSAEDSVVDEINITVPVSCTISGTGMTSHNASINNGLYEDDIGSTTFHAFCNDADGFAIYAAGYTGDEVGGANSNKLVGTNASGNAVIETGLATTAGNPDVSNWAMKLTATQDSGDTTGANAFAIDSAPNTSGGADVSFTQYHVVPNEYTKVAHKNSGTDMTDTTGGVKLTTTYAAYISKTQPADTYSGQVKYTLVHPSSVAPLSNEQVGVIYNANGSRFAGGRTTNRVVYTSSPMYIATTPLIAKSANVGDDGTQNGSYATGDTLIPIIATGASKMKVVIRYGLSGSTVLPVIEGDYDGQGAPDHYEMIEGPATGTATYIFDSDTVTFYMVAYSAPTSTDGQDYGYYAEVYPVYTTEQIGTEPSTEFAIGAVEEGTYAQTTDWYGSWYADINNEHYDFTDESEIEDFISSNMATLGGMNIDLYRGLTFTEAYTRANKTQDGGYYKQQDLNNSICQTVAITQNQTVKDVRDDNTYMIGKLKDGRCWMLNNLVLNPTYITTATNMNANNTNASTEAITNYLHGGSSNTGWSNTVVRENTSLYSTIEDPLIYSYSRNSFATSYGPASVNGAARLGIYYNFCAATVGTYCYADNVDIPDTTINPPQDICSANWRLPTGGANGEFAVLYSKYNTTQDATNAASLQYNLSVVLAGHYYNSLIRDSDYGFFWSSTSYNRTIYSLRAGSSFVFPLNESSAGGLSIRCIVSN